MSKSNKVGKQFHDHETIWLMRKRDCTTPRDVIPFGLTMGNDTKQVLGTEIQVLQNYLDRAVFPQVCPRWTNVFIRNVLLCDMKTFSVLKNLSLFHNPCVWVPSLTIGE